jgi:histidinol phosphatase-like enzyme
MARIEEIFTILRTLINSTTESTIAINKCTLSTVITCLQVTHKKIDMFKHQNKLLSDELSSLRHQQCDFNNQNDIKDENNEDIQLTSNESHKREDQLDEVSMSEKVADKCIVRPWKELQFKRNRYGLRYVKDANNLFHIPNYCEPICFVRGGFLNNDKKTKLEDIHKEHV